MRSKIIRTFMSDTCLGGEERGWCTRHKNTLGNQNNLQTIHLVNTIAIITSTKHHVKENMNAYVS